MEYSKAQCQHSSFGATVTSDISSYDYFKTYNRGAWKDITELKTKDFKLYLHELNETLLNYPFQIKHYGTYALIGYSSFDEWLLQGIGITYEELEAIATSKGLSCEECDKYHLHHMLKIAVIQKIPTPGLEVERAIVEQQIIEERQAREDEDKAREMLSLAGIKAVEDLTATIKASMKKGVIPKMKFIMKSRAVSITGIELTMHSKQTAIFHSDDPQFAYYNGKRERVLFSDVLTDDHRAFIYDEVAGYAKDHGLELHFEIVNQPG